MTQGPPGMILLPVDPVAISRRKSGSWSSTTTSWAAEVSGVLRKKPGFRDPKSSSIRPSRSIDRRFTCAHALGHYSRNIELRRRGAWEFVDGRDLFTADSDVEESYATEFAAELLMPRPVLNALDDSTSVASLAALFGVTGDVMGARLDRIGWRR